jgi:excisionase family DNA binding protein
MHANTPNPLPNNTGPTARSLRAKEAARVYGVGESTLWLYVHQGKLAPVRLGKRLTLFPVDQLEALFVTPRA